MAKWFFVIILLGPIFVFGEKDYITLADRLTKQHCDFVAKEYCLEPSGSGGGMMFDVELIHESFRSNRALVLPEARRLYILSSQDLLSRLNGDRKVRPYLRQYPFKVENLTYGIHFYDRQMNSIPPPYISAVTSHRSNWVCYWMQDGGPIGRVVHEESYDDALRIVEEEERNRPKIVLQQAPKPANRSGCVQNRFRSDM